MIGRRFTDGCCEEDLESDLVPEFSEWEGGGERKRGDTWSDVAGI